MGFTRQKFNKTSIRNRCMFDALTSVLHINHAVIAFKDDDGALYELPYESIPQIAYATQSRFRALVKKEKNSEM